MTVYLLSSPDERRFDADSASWWFARSARARLTRSRDRAADLADAGVGGVGVGPDLGELGPVGGGSGIVDGAGGAGGAEQGAPAVGAQLEGAAVNRQGLGRFALGQQQLAQPFARGHALHGAQGWTAVVDGDRLLQGRQGGFVLPAQRRCPRLQLQRGHLVKVAELRIQLGGQAADGGRGGQRGG